jgi:multidrug efflux system outer membrane protein
LSGLIAAIRTKSESSVAHNILVRDDTRIDPRKESQETGSGGQGQSRIGPMNVWKTRVFSRNLVVATAVVGLAGCVTESSFQEPSFPFSAFFKGAPSSTTTLLSNAEWWKRLSDPGLDALIAQGLEGNLDLKIAKERLIQAHAARGEIQSNLTASASGEARIVGDLQGWQSENASASLGLNWLLDPLGKRSALERAAAARVDIVEAEAAAARLLIISEISAAYVDLRYYQRALQLREGQLRSRRETREIIAGFVEQSIASRLELVRADALISETEALVPGLRAAVATQRNALAILVGMQPGDQSLALPPVSSSRPLPTMRPDVGIPADLVRNRPDIIIKEREYYAAIAQADAATADIFPTLSLGGTISLSLTGGGSYSFGPAVQFPVIPTTSKEATIEVRRSQAREALAEWNKTVLLAIGEVEDGLVRYAASKEATAAAKRTVSLYNQSAEITRQLIGQGGSTVKDLLEAEQRVADAEITLADLERQLVRDFVRLNASLGSSD